MRERRELVARPAGERILAELARLSGRGWRRLDELGLLVPLGGSSDREADVDLLEDADFLLTVFLGEALERLPISNQLRRYARVLLRAERPHDLSPRSIHRFRRATEPWALQAAAFVGGGKSLYDAVERARAEEPAEPLVRGDELGLAPGPEVGRLLDRIAEERAAGTVSTREEALALVRREAGE